MVRTKLLLLFLAFSQVAGAASLKSQLIDVNNQWAYHQADLLSISNEEAFYSSNDIIQKHLFLVHQILSQKDISALSEQQKTNRAESLQHLFRYAERGIFPQNLTHKEGRRPVFIDHRGVHCAVGYLIKKSGNAWLSNRISANMNYYYLKDMHDVYLNDWVSNSGFTADELAWIQPGYPFPVNWQSLKGGVTGPVNAMVSDNMGGLLAAGTFDSADAVAAGNFAHWYAGFSGFDWGPFTNGNGTNGPIYDLLWHNNELYVAGEFFDVDGVPTGAAVAKWDGNQWTALGDFYIGALVNYVNDLEIYRDTLYAGGFFKSKATAPEAFDNLAKWDGTQWVRAMSDSIGPELRYGEVNALHVHNGKLFVGGQFSLSDGTENVFAIDGNSFEKLPAQVPAAVYALETYNGELYAGGDILDPNQGQDTAGLVVYRQGRWTYDPYVFLTGPNWPASSTPGTVYALTSTPQGLAVGGSFSHYPGIGNYAHNLVLLENGQFRSLGSLDSTVESLLYKDDQLYMGGEFTHGQSFNTSVELGHITALHLPNVGLAEDPRGALQVYPNPASSFLRVDMGTDPIDQVKLYDITGARIGAPRKDTPAGLEIDLSQLPAGSYLLKIQSGQAVRQEKFVVQR